MRQEQQQRVVSGARISGRLHLGNYLGAISNWVRLQEDYDCFFFCADWHGLTTGYEDTSGFMKQTEETFLDIVACGIDPQRCVFFVQSDVKEHAELYLLLSLITPLGWLERVPTYKEQLQNITGREITTHGFLGYPVLQSADVLLYRGQLVPVGEDQLPHLELCREIARRFNHLYQPIFPEPQALLTKTPNLLGIDGRKMSKSYGNEIPVSAAPKEIKQKVSMMVTDPQRVRRIDPGDPEVCAVHSFHGLFGQEQGAMAEGCRDASIGCVECKKRLTAALEEYLAPIWDKRQELLKNPSRLGDIRRAGAEKARNVAQSMLEQIRSAMRVG